VPIRGLSSLGFDLGRMRVHDPAGLSSAETLPKQRTYKARIQARQRDAMERKVPGRELRILPLVGH
jgi:hypothetical protein